MGWAGPSLAGSTGEGDLPRANAKNGDRRNGGGGTGSRGAEALIAPEGGGRLNRRVRTSISREHRPRPHPIPTSEATGRSKR